MSEDLIICPHCKTEVPKGRFCNACGKSLAKSKDDGDTGTEANHKAILDAIYEDVEEPELMEHISYPEFQFSIDGMDIRNMAILFAKSELKVLDKELDRIIAEISSTRQALDLTHADKDLLIARAKELRREFDVAKARREKLRNVEGETPLSNTLSHLSVQETKLKKLESAEKALDPVVFEEEKKRLQVRIKNLKKDLSSALKTSKQWLRSMDSEIKRLQRELSRLDAKLKIGDVSQTAYDSKKNDMNRSIGVITGGKKTLEEIIRLAEKSK